MLIIFLIIILICIFVKNDYSVSVRMYNFLHLQIYVKYIIRQCRKWHMYVILHVASLKKYINPFMKKILDIIIIRLLT